LKADGKPLHKKQKISDEDGDIKKTDSDTSSDQGSDKNEILEKKDKEHKEKDEIESV
jgi:hypothetical protein